MMCCGREVSKWIEQISFTVCNLKMDKNIYLHGRLTKNAGLQLLGQRQSQRICRASKEDNMLFIVDEASGVADAIMEAILGTLSGANNKLLMCGNPTKTSGTFLMLFMQTEHSTNILRYRRGTVRGLIKRILRPRSEIWQGQQCCARACGR